MDFAMGWTAEQGSRQLIWSALGPDGKDGEHVRHLHGAYISTLEVHDPSDWVLSAEGYETQERVWVRFGFLALVLVYVSTNDPSRTKH